MQTHSLFLKIKNKTTHTEVSMLNRSYPQKNIASCSCDYQIHKRNRLMTHDYPSEKHNNNKKETTLSRARQTRKRNVLHNNKKTHTHKRGGVLHIGLAYLLLLVFFQDSTCTFNAACVIQAHKLRNILQTSKKDTTTTTHTKETKKLK